MDLSKKDKQLNEKIKEVETRINTIQQSTKTYLPNFTKPHNILRAKFSWYETWHMNPRVTVIHVVILVTYIILVLTIIFLVFMNCF